MIFIVVNVINSYPACVLLDVQYSNNGNNF